ncbi:hypothetical protein [Sinimarinibacterium sp. NLF-5-8]|uniref:hypothetical protein n=1 Tax=Sinimarinibacterium sp. NLF-5-8 TaxID=2698684 RepID=UPI00137C39F3|nr:hypothetical protein [Sinimarinibacterium sp. NLF-5-8]QHS08993.1 hypothetical protein GT972_01780 [Sinimarinibacterium sp. NLF-5-8]
MRVYKASVPVLSALLFCAGIAHAEQNPPSDPLASSSIGLTEEDIANSQIGDDIQDASSVLPELDQYARSASGRLTGSSQIDFDQGADNPYSSVLESAGISKDSVNATGTPGRGEVGANMRTIQVAAARCPVWGEQGASIGQYTLAATISGITIQCATNHSRSETYFNLCSDAPEQCSLLTHRIDGDESETQVPPEDQDVKLASVLKASDEQKGNDYLLTLTISKQMGYRDGEQMAQAGQAYSDKLKQGDSTFALSRDRPLINAVTGEFGDGETPNADWEQARQIPLQDYGCDSDASDEDENSTRIKCGDIPEQTVMLNASCEAGDSPNVQCVEYANGPERKFTSTCTSQTPWRVTSPCAVVRTPVVMFLPGCADGQKFTKSFGVRINKVTGESAQCKLSLGCSSRVGIYPPFNGFYNPPRGINGRNNRPEDLFIECACNKGACAFQVTAWDAKCDVNNDCKITARGMINNTPWDEKDFGSDFIVTGQPVRWVDRFIETNGCAGVER